MKLSVVSRSGLIAIVALFAASAPAYALPDPNAPIDPTKRADVSTADAVRPGDQKAPQSRTIPGRVVRMSEIPIRRAAVEEQRAPVQVRETRDKKIIQPERRDFSVRKNDRVRRAENLPAALPRIDRKRFNRLLAEYQQGRVPADEMLHADIALGTRRASLDDINRFAGPRATLEAQGIPVVPAASGETPARHSAPVPLPQTPAAPR